MKIKIHQLAIGAGIAGFLSLGAVTYAFAQSAPGTSTPTPAQPGSSTAPAAPGSGQAPADDPNCPNMGGSSGSGTGTGTAQKTRAHRGPRQAPASTQNGNTAA